MSRDDEPHEGTTEREPLSRRSFLKGAGGAATTGVLAGGLLVGSRAPGAGLAGGTGTVEELAGEVEILLDVNGAPTKVVVEPRTTLLSALRDRATPALTGTKLVCDRGQCGACTVIVDGRSAYACLLLAADVRGRKIRTIEGLGAPGSLAPLQESFWKHDASMCGFCTPGFVMAIQACLERRPGASLEEIQESCAGNACRCGTQPQIFAAALEVARSAGTLKGGR
jgi:aerobic-type carbon monoxide dehydrogenase small subunit (CoxS/CutS family)